MVRFRVEVMVILIVAATSHFNAVEGRLILGIGMKPNILNQFRV